MDLHLREFGFYGFYNPEIKVNASVRQKSSLDADFSSICLCRLPYFSHYFFKGQNFAVIRSKCAEPAGPYTLAGKVNIPVYDVSNHIPCCKGAEFIRKPEEFERRYLKE